MGAAPASAAADRPGARTGTQTAAPLLRDLAVGGLPQPDIRDEAHEGRGDKFVCAWIQGPGRTAKASGSRGCLVDLVGHFGFDCLVDEDRLKRHDLTDAEWARLEPLLSAGVFPGALLALVRCGAGPVQAAAGGPLDQRAVGIHPRASCCALPWMRRSVRMAACTCGAALP